MRSLALWGLRLVLTVVIIAAKLGASDDSQVPQTKENSYRLSFSPLEKSLYRLRALRGELFEGRAGGPVLAIIAAARLFSVRHEQFYE